MQIDEVLVYLECLLIQAEEPEYIEVSLQHGFIYIVLMKGKYSFYSIKERITGVFLLLQLDCPNIVENYPILIECFSDVEFDDMIGNYYDRY